MTDVTINENNLQYNEVKEIFSKVRAILIDENNQILIANYGGVYMDTDVELIKSIDVFLKHQVPFSMPSELSFYPAP